MKREFIAETSVILQGSIQELCIILTITLLSGNLN